MRVGRRGAAGDRGASRGEGSTVDSGKVGHGEERTLNMKPMFVTLEVSKLSGWLNADAYCRGSKEYDAKRGTRVGRRGVADDREQRAGEGSTADMGAGHGEERT